MLKEQLTEKEIKELVEILCNEITINKNQITDRIHLDKDLLQQLLQWILWRGKSLLKYIDLSEVSFDECDVTYCDFSETNAKIDPQRIRDKNLYKTNLRGLDLSDACFDDVGICETNLEGTNAKINPQTVKSKSLFWTNLKGLDLSEADFDGVNIKRANLEGTNAYILLNLIKDNSLWKANLNGCTLIGDITKCDTEGTILDKATILDDYYSRSKRMIKSLFENK